MLEHSMVPPTTATDKAEQARWFAEEIQPHESKLRGWLRARFPSLTDIDDLVQESYARLLRARVSGKVANAKTYLFATARNAALDLFRRRRIVTLEGVETIGDLFVLEGSPGAAESLSHEQDLELLAEAVQALPRCCRHVLVLQKIHGLSYKEIAVRLGISERTVNAQIAKGMLRCRAYVRAQRTKREQP
jgi:RNA polymerase sigma-70 factor (ECF subfamily)